MAGWRWASVAVGLLALLATSTACTDTATAATDARAIGILRSVVDDDHSAFVDELRQQGWHHGRDIVIYPRNPSEVYEDEDAARAALRSWHASNPLELVVAFSTPYAQLAMEELPDVPHLVVVNDLVAAGLVEDPAAPEATTGVSFWTPPDRTLDLAIRALDGIDRLGYLAPEDDPAVPGHRSGALAAADERGVDVVEATFRGDDPDTIEVAVDELADGGVDAVWLASSNATLRALPELEHHLERRGLPAIANTDHASFAVVVVSPDGEQLRRQLARQAARALAGTSITSVPVETPRRFVVVLNRTQAESLGLPEMDPALLRRADLVR